MCHFFPVHHLGIAFFGPGRRSKHNTISQYPLHFAWLNKNFIQLSAVNLHSNALVRFQKAVMDKVICRPLDSHRKYSVYGKFWGTSSWSRLWVIGFGCHKRCIFFFKSHNSFKKQISQIPQKSIDYTSKRPALWLSHFLSWSDIFFNAILNDIYCLRQLIDTLTMVLFSKGFPLLVVNCRRTSSTLFIFKICIFTTDLFKPVPCYLITSGSFIPCSLDIGSCLGDIMIKLEQWS